MGPSACAPPAPKPELEVFDAGHVELARQLVDEGLIEPPPMFPALPGHSLGCTGDTGSHEPCVCDAPSPCRKGAHWGGLRHFPPPQMPMVAEAVNQGRSCTGRPWRTISTSNAGFLPPTRNSSEKAATIVSALGAKVAEPDEARQLLKLNGPRRMIKADLAGKRTLRPPARASGIGLATAELFRPMRRQGSL